ncbi:alpha/beta-hydrolase [Fragilariopsis cylindrus CCMP1102]|uniref:Alpha/beta-hydrolase n=1 Tax=Fragilariopsis cylindrus CCMP1102 TaxID=635003 RepID=A0A1E7EWS8_9STRA|nr:alpha/beta-hydrolase [Fragilariopsis cylindrus CCMP1102]|eukprot:OEU10255.1 alpha/beta-hydrolase [Fragilariopsis cylindrus CCMP1102]
MRVVICPGMGCDIHSNWYQWFADEIIKRKYVTECILRNFPDQPKCRESVWLPFLVDKIGLDQDTVVIGHSTGAALAMRLLEYNGEEKKKLNGPLKGVILVAAAHTDLGDEGERLSEYFNRSWDWTKMKNGADMIHLFHGTDDHLIPVIEARYIADKMKGDNFEYSELPNKSHFFHPFSEILDVMDDKFGGEGDQLL